MLTESESQITYGYVAVVITKTNAAARKRSERCNYAVCDTVIITKGRHQSGDCDADDRTLIIMRRDAPHNSEHRRMTCI